MPVFHVELRRSGPAWDATQPLERQSDWPAHAAFMNALVADGVVLLGGPLDDEHRVVLVVEAESEEAIRERLAADPWSGSHLAIHEIAAWTIRLDGREPAGPT